jgi:hypothetical protein
MVEWSMWRCKVSWQSQHMMVQSDFVILGNVVAICDDWSTLLPSDVVCRIDLNMYSFLYSLPRLLANPSSYDMVVEDDGWLQGLGEIRRLLLWPCQNNLIQVIASSESHNSHSVRRCRKHESYGWSMTLSMWRKDSSGSVGRDGGRNNKTINQEKDFCSAFFCWGMQIWIVIVFRQLGLLENFSFLLSVWWRWSRLGMQVPLWPGNLSDTRKIVIGKINPPETVDIQFDNPHVWRIFSW